MCISASARQQSLAWHHRLTLHRQMVPSDHQLLALWRMQHLLDWMSQEICYTKLLRGCRKEVTSVTELPHLSTMQHLPRGQSQVSFTLQAFATLAQAAKARVYDARQRRHMQSMDKCFDSSLVMPAHMCVNTIVQLRSRPFLDKAATSGYFNCQGDSPPASLEALHHSCCLVHFCLSALSSPCCAMLSTPKQGNFTAAAEVVLHGLPLLVEEDRGPGAATDPLSKLPSTEPPLPHTQQNGSQLGTISVDAMQVDDADSAQMPSGPSAPEQLSGAATGAQQQVEFVQPVLQAQHHWQQAQQGLPTQHAQHDSAAAALPSGLHWGLFPAQAQAMQASQQPSIALPPPPAVSLDPQQHQPGAVEEMPEQAVPRDVTWMQLHSAAGPGHGQGALGQPLGLDCFRPSGAVWTEAGALPPALAQQDPHTGHWIPTLVPLNPFVNHQLAKTNQGAGTGLTAQAQSSQEGYFATAHPHSPSASATKKRPRAPRLPASLEPDAPVPAPALSALDRLELHRMQEGTPAQLASLPNPPNLPYPPDCTAAGNTTFTMHQPSNHAALGSTYHQHAASHGQQWHSQAQASGCMPFLPTHAGPSHYPFDPMAPGGVIDLCSPPATQWPLRQQNGGGAEAQESAHSQLWHYGRQPTAEPAAAPQPATSGLHKELTEFAVMATATQVRLEIDTHLPSPSPPSPTFLPALPHLLPASPHYPACCYSL